MTPRQMAAYQFLADRRRERDLREQLGVGCLIQSGDSKAVKAQAGEWDDQ